MTLKSFSLLEAALAQSFFSQISNLAYLGKTGQVYLLYTKTDSKENFAVQVDENQQGIVPADTSEDRLKALSINEIKWSVWLEEQVTRLKNSYKIDRIEITYDDSQPTDISLSAVATQNPVNNGYNQSQQFMQP